MSKPITQAAAHTLADVVALKIHQAAVSGLAGLEESQRAMLDCPDVAPWVRIQCIVALHEAQRAISRSFAKIQDQVEQDLNRSYF